MTLTTHERITVITEQLQKVDDFAIRFGVLIQNMKAKHKISGAHLEYAYIEHFNSEITGLSKLFQYLLKDDNNRKYVFFATRASMEVFLHLEYVLKLSKQGGNELLSLLSKDMAQSAAAINEAAPIDDNHHIHKTLQKINLVNKILKTDFDLAKVKSNDRPFPNMRALCQQSKLCLKDSHGETMYHIYKMYSESNHLRLSNHHTVSSDPELETCWALEYFIESYIKFYEQILVAGNFSTEFSIDLNLIKQSLGLK